jgi:hypothetical protein
MKKVSIMKEGNRRYWWGGHPSLVGLLFVVFFTLLIIAGNVSAIPTTSSSATTKPVLRVKRAVKRNIVTDQTTIDRVATPTVVARDDMGEARVTLEAAVVPTTERILEGGDQPSIQRVTSAEEMAAAQDGSVGENASNSSKRSTPQRRGRAAAVPMKQVKVDELMRSLGLDTPSVVVRKDPRRRAADGTATTIAIDATKKGITDSTNRVSDVPEKPADEKLTQTQDELQDLIDLGRAKRDRSSQSALTVEELLAELNHNKKRLDVTGISSPDHLLDLLKSGTKSSAARPSRPSSGRRLGGRGLRRVELAKSLDASKVSAKEFDDYLRQMTSLKESKKRDLTNELQSWWSALYGRGKQLWLSNQRAPLGSSGSKSLSSSTASTGGGDSTVPPPTGTTPARGNNGAGQSNTTNSTTTPARPKSGNMTAPMKPYTQRKTSSHVQLSKSAKTAAAAVQDSILPSTPRLNTIMLPELETNVKTTKS